MQYLKRSLIIFINLVFLLETSFGLTSLNIADVKITFNKKTHYTDFTLSSQIKGSLNNVWIAVGFNDKPKMVV